MEPPFFSFRSVRGVIFDWDGILADTKLDFSSVRKKYFGGTRRLPLLESAPLLDEPTRSEYLDAIKAEEMRGAEFSVPVEGARETVEFLNDQNVPWCVLSRNCRESIDLAAEKTGFTLPEHVFSREAEHVKPDPRAMLDAACAIGVPPKNCLVVGDYLYELLAARRAEMRCVLVRENDPASASLADACYPTMTALADAFVRDEPVVPWEYHPAAERFGPEALSIFARLTVCVDCRLDGGVLDKLNALAGLGVGKFTVPEGRSVSVEELRCAVALSPRWLQMSAADALRSIFSARFPLVNVENGTDGTPLSSIASPEDFARAELHRS